jgi:hypothetical protein
MLNPGGSYGTARVGAVINSAISGIEHAVPSRYGQVTAQLKPCPDTELTKPLC